MRRQERLRAEYRQRPRTNRARRLWTARTGMLIGFERPRRPRTRVAPRSLRGRATVLLSRCPRRYAATACSSIRALGQVVSRAENRQPDSRMHQEQHRAPQDRATYSPKRLRAPQSEFAAIAAMLCQADAHAEWRHTSASTGRLGSADFRTRLSLDSCARGVRSIGVEPKFDDGGLRLLCIHLAVACKPRKRRGDD